MTRATVTIPQRLAAASPTTAPPSIETYSLGTVVAVPSTVDGIVSAAVYGFYTNISSTDPDADTPPNGYTYGAIDVLECAGAQGSSTGANETYFEVLLSNGSTAPQDILVGAPAVTPLSAESGLGSVAPLGPDQCDRGWIVFDIPYGTTAVSVEFSGATASFPQGDGIVQWPV